MRPVDGSISINRPIVPDNKRIDCDKSSDLDLTGTAARCPCLDDCAPDDSASGIHATHALTKPLRLRSALTELPLSPILPTFLLGVQIRTPGWKLEWLYMTRFDDRTKRIREFRIAVMNEVSTVFEETQFVHGDIPRDLLHPGFIGMCCDPGDLNAAALEMDEEQHVVGALWKNPRK